jgi:N-acetylglutamate synthase-like GNAT family acetyltransferase
MPTNDFATRIATPDDAVAVQALLQASYPVLMASAYDKAILDPALELMTKANRSLLASGTYYVAEARGGLVVGCGGWTRERPGSGELEAKLGHIRHFATHPAWTNRGIGRAIYQLCEAGARSAGVATFECHASLNGEGFYAALGFESVRRIDIEFAPHVALPCVLMRRQI